MFDVVFSIGPLEETFIKPGVDDQAVTPDRRSQHYPGDIIYRQQSGYSSTGSRTSTSSFIQTPSPDPTSHHFPGDLLQTSPQPYSFQGTQHPIPHSATMPVFPSSQLQTDGTPGYGQVGAAEAAYQGNVSSPPSHYGGSEPSLHTHPGYSQRPPSGEINQ